VAKPRDDRQKDLLRPALEEVIISLIRWRGWRARSTGSFSTAGFPACARRAKGRPPLPTRLVAGLFILKHMHNLSDEVLCALAGEPALPILLRRAELLPRVAV
jgi:transposase, IS5 family